MNEIEEIWKRLMDAADGAVSVIDYARDIQFSECYNAIKFITKGTGAEVTASKYKPVPSSGVISIIGPGITFSGKHGKIFEMVSKIASNVNVYPRSDGSVEMDLMFYGLTKTIGRADK